MTMIDWHIQSEVSKVGKERFVPIPPALVAWLSVLRKDNQLAVYERSRLHKAYSRICDKAGMKWKKNGPRKSFNTCDAGLSRSLVATATKAGNSPEMVERDYRKAVSQ